jgi:short-subunit dehydrogenase involved in D-alanine esterification of teichoic acids
LEVAVLPADLVLVELALILYFLPLLQTVVVVVEVIKPKVQMAVQVVEKAADMILPLGLRVVVVLEILQTQAHHKEITVELVEEIAAVKFLPVAVVAAQVV